MSLPKTGQLLATCFVLSSIGLCPIAAVADEPSGVALAVVQATDVVGAGGLHLLQPEAPVFMGDKVKTGASGEAQIRFRDDTRVVVGPGSSLLIDRFLFNPDSTPKSVSINAVRGTFRFISGVGPKTAYVIRTPSATLGLRGTRFDLNVSARETTVALLEGGLRVCNSAGRCVEVRGRCEVVVAGNGDDLRKVDAGTEKSARLDSGFPYIRSQASLLSMFRTDVSACSVMRASNGNPGESTYVSNTPVPPVPPVPPSDSLGNPGNNKSVGHAGETPGPGDWGSGAFGKSDSSTGGQGANASASAASGAGNGNGGGNGGGNGNAGGNGGGNGNAGGNGNGH